MSTAVAVIKYEIVVCTCSCMCTFVYLQTVRTSPLRHTGDITEAETYQAADVEVALVEMRTQRGAERMPVGSELLHCLTR